MFIKIINSAEWSTSAGLLCFPAWKRFLLDACCVTVPCYIISNFKIKHNDLLDCNHIYIENWIWQNLYRFCLGRIVGNLFLLFCHDCGSASFMRALKCFSGRQLWNTTAWLSIQHLYILENARSYCNLDILCTYLIVFVQKSQTNSFCIHTSCVGIRGFEQTSNYFHGNKIVGLAPHIYLTKK